MRWWLQGGRVIDPSTGEDTARDVYIDGDRLVDPPSDTAGWTVVDCSGQIVAPGFVDLHASLPKLEADALAAIESGFTTVVHAPDHPRAFDQVVEVRDLLLRAADLPLELLATAALTRDLAGEELSEMALLRDAGCSAISQGRVLIEDTRALWNAIDYAGPLGLPLLLRAGEAALERGGIVKGGKMSVRLGLPGIPSSSEEIGVYRLAGIARKLEVPIHITHIWSARGVKALRRARGFGAPLTGSTTSHHLAHVETPLETSHYSGWYRFVPPLGDEGDRAELLRGIEDGTLVAVATDNRPLHKDQWDLPIQEAVAGAPGHRAAWGLVCHAVKNPVTAVRLLTTGPAQVMGLPVPSLRTGAQARVVVADPSGRSVGPVFVGGAMFADRSDREAGS